MSTTHLLIAAAFVLALLSLFPVGRQVLRSCFTVDPALITLAPGLRAAGGMFLVLYAAHATGLHEAGVPAALGVLLTSLADFSEPYAERLKSMLLAALVTAAAVLTGGLVAGNVGWHFAAALVAAAAVGFAGAIGPRSGLVGLFCLALFSLYSATAVPFNTALTMAGWYLAGGVASVVVACAGWPFAGYYPTRRKLAVGFQQLSAACGEPWARSADLRVVVAIQAAAASVASSRADEITRQRLSLLLDEMEACRVLVVALGRDEASAGEGALAAAREVARELARSLSGYRNHPRLHAALGRLELACSSVVKPEAGPLLAALSVRLTKAVFLLSDHRPMVSDHGSMGHVPAQAAQGPSRGRENVLATRPEAFFGSAFLSTLAGLRRHLHWRDVYARHAMKLAGTYLVGTGLAMGPLNSLLDGHGFWIPLTVAWVCKPDVSGSINRFSMRLCGTVLGVLLSALLLYFITTPVLLMLLTAVGAFVMGATLFANYSVTVMGVTMLVLSISASMGNYTEDLADARLLATLLGCGLVLISAYVLPVRSSTVAPAQLDAMAALLSEPPEQPRTVEALGPRSPYFMAAQRHRLAVVAALAAAEAEPRAPWEDESVPLELRALASKLEGLERTALERQLPLALTT